MSHNIKQLKPKKNGRYEQGYINPLGCNKVFESQKGKPIIYRSSYELAFVEWCETSKNVKKWGSECVPIKYILCTNGTQHTYYPDYIVEMESGEVYLIEVKPFNQTQKPKSSDYYSYAWQTYIKNRCKWEAAKLFCEHNNMKFKILTERVISKLK